jgi:hypothetical protein
MNLKLTGRCRRTGLSMGIVIGLLVFAAAYSQDSAAQSAGDNAASAKAFVAASTVLLHPRCVNCHPQGERPLQGDEGRPHAMNVKRGPEGQGKVGLRCIGCHQVTNLAGVHMPPGAPDWALPPEDMPMVFERTAPREICLHLKDPAQNGHRSPEEVVEHVRKDSLVLWGWDPGEGRTPVPMPHEQFVQFMAEWAEKGAACPE